MAKGSSYRILVKTKQGVKQLLRIRELPDRSVLYSFCPLDGRSRSILHSQAESVVPSGGEQTFTYEGLPVMEETDHLTYHQAGPHVITSPGSSKHWGRIVQAPLDAGETNQLAGLILPAALHRFPDHVNAIDPARDTQIDLEVLKVDWVHFRISILGEALSQSGGKFAVPQSLVDPSATSVDSMFKGGLTWFLLPLASCTVLFVVYTGPVAPPRTVHVRYEPVVGGKVHIAYFE